MEDVISKKDLLKTTGISYGQLYRWKREMLIPEEWFVKQSSITGQETFFPREKILRRVQRILELKDAYSLEELAGMLSPEAVDRNFHEEELDQFDEIDVQVAAKFMDVLEKDVFSFREIIAMIAFTTIKKDLCVDEDGVSQLIQYSAKQILGLKSLDMSMNIVAIEDVMYVVFYADDMPFIMDERIHIKKQIQLQEVSNAMKEKYREVFHFTIDKEGKHDGK